MGHPKLCQDPSHEERLEQFQQKLAELYDALARAQLELATLRLGREQGAIGPTSFVAPSYSPIEIPPGVADGELTRSELLLLEILRTSPSPLELQEIVQAMRRSGTNSSEGAVRVYVSHLRKKLRRATRGADLIRTVRYGYGFRHDVAQKMGLEKEQEGVPA
jgi:hypothetical protein